MRELRKDQQIDLDALYPNLETLIVGLGWKINSVDQDFDLDTSAFMLTHTNGIRSRDDFVYYNNLLDPSGALEHSGDSITGSDSGDAEQIKINIFKIPPEIGHLTFVVTIHDADIRNQTFGQVENAYIRLVEPKSGTELLRYNLGNEFSEARSIVVGDLFRKDNHWSFDAVGVPFSGGLDAISQDFNLRVNKE